jgi:hypothetical protein
MILTREQLLEKSKRRLIDVTLSDGAVVKLQSLTEIERAEYNAEMLDADGAVDKEQFKYGTVKLLARMIVDENGKRMFHDSEWPIIAELDSLVTEELGDAARNHIGFNRADAKKSQATGDSA